MHCVIILSLILLFVEMISKAMPPYDPRGHVTFETALQMA